MLSAATPLVLFGAGKMGAALLSAWLKAGLDAGGVRIVDPGLAKGDRQALGKKGVGAFATAAEAAGGERAKVVVLAVKPQIFDEVLPAAADLAGPGSILVSIAAGIGLARMTAAVGADTAVIRAMPNTPAQIGVGMTVAVASKKASDEQRAIVEALMRPAGAFAWIDDENLMDAVTAVSGSGPAYVFYLAECLAAAAQDAGLDADLAARLARQTVAGGGALLGQSPDPAETLRRNVTSPGGTTEAALKVLMADDGLARLMSKAVAAAQARSRELG